MSDSLSVYYGLLFNACLPLEVSLNFCSMGCKYCFSNLNSPNRQADTKQIMNLLNKHQERDSFAAFLLREKYPIQCSNHVDFFASSNWKIADPIMQTLVAMDIPFSLQTKGSKHVYEAIEYLPQTVWYVSIATLNEDIARKVEPGAFSIAERLKMLEKIVERGDRVTVGINPLVPEWIDDPLKMCQELASRGVEGVWVQPLHLSNAQLKVMPQKDKDILGASVISKARSRYKNKEVKELYHNIRAIAQECGMEIYDTSQRERSDYFQPYKDVYKKTYPVLQDFVNLCYDLELPNNSPIYCQDYMDFFVPQLPKGEFNLKNHIYAAHSKHDIVKFPDMPKTMSYAQLLHIIWQNDRMNYCPVHAKCFAWAGEKLENNTWNMYVDDDDLPILMFSRDGYDTLFVEATPESWDVDDEVVYVEE